MAILAKAPKLPVQQLSILSICRFAEPLALSSVWPYLPEMIESFNVPETEVAKWAGVTSAVFSLSQAVTAIAWGRASDRFGRKPVILACSACIMLSSLAFGFSRSLGWAIAARSMAGASSGNVGVLRTTVAELVPQKELQPRAFSIMPLVWTIGATLGPTLGGALANPAEKYPRLFGSSVVLTNYPYALPNLVAAAIFLVSLLIGFLFLEESLAAVKNKRDFGRILGGILTRPFGQGRQNRRAAKYFEEHRPLLWTRMSSVSGLSRFNEDRVSLSKQDQNPHVHRPSRDRDIFNRQSSINLVAYTLLALHSIAFDQLIPVFMHHPPQRDRANDPNVRFPIKFAGGFGLDAERIGLIFTIYGIAGMLIQFLIFPPLARRYGALLCFKFCTLSFAPIYILVPFTVLFPTPVSQQIGILIIMLLKCFVAIVSFPCSTILLTNSAASLRVLGTLNGVATSVSALGRAAGPAIGGETFSLGIRAGYVILPWWILAAFAAVGSIPVFWLEEMDGFGSSVGGEDEDEEHPIDSDGEISAALSHKGDFEYEANLPGDEFLVDNEETLEDINDDAPEFEDALLPIVKP